MMLPRNWTLCGVNLESGQFFPVFLTSDLRKLLFMPCTTLVRPANGKSPRHPFSHAPGCSRPRLVKHHNSSLAFEIDKMPPPKIENHACSNHPIHCRLSTEIQRPSLRDHVSGQHMPLNPNARRYLGDDSYERPLHAA